MSAGKKTGREACVEELQPIVDEATKYLFKFKDENAINPHREATNKSDTAKSVQDTFNHYTENHETLSHEFLEVTSKDVRPFKLSIFTPEKTPAPAGGRPCLYFIHGGGLVTNNAFSGIHSIFP